MSAEASLHHITEDARRLMPGLRVDRTLQNNGPSGHGVMFGETPEWGSVVVKPHKDFATAQNEAYKTAQIAKLGVVTPVPVAVLRGGPASYFVTQRIEDLATLEDVDWAAPEDASVGLMQRVSADLAHLHKLGGTHGDYQPKNVGHLGVRGVGAYVAFDLERSAVDNLGEVGASRRLRDLFMFGGRVLVRGYEADRSPSYRAGSVYDNFVAPYVDSLGADIERVTVPHQRLASDYEKVAVTGKMRLKVSEK